MSDQERAYGSDEAHEEIRRIRRTLLKLERLETQGDLVLVGEPVVQLLAARDHIKRAIREAR